MNTRIYEDTDAAALACAELIADLSNVKYLSHISLSGGSTPKRMFAMMAQEPLASRIRWASLHFWWGDERCVAPDDADSNYGEVKQLLFDMVPVDAANIHRIHGEDEPSAECLRISAETQAQVPSGSDGVPVFDLIILGMGTDGHTASLFPGAPLDSTSEDPQGLYLAAVHPDSGQIRVSKTASLLKAAKSLVFLVTGDSKAEKIAEVAGGSASYPAARVSDMHPAPLWILDTAAAKGLN